ncbi:NADPH-dependent FMN reductase [Methanoculleus taiwanensis]|uniref:NADPH-dependent FMN reductase n=1 Tax=Methanoculleus taiwanensis TaxID=1550565 RepID=A0A498H3V0_9EURY|nr:flavodoxin family protein [Methanoculleus taiwanensis]RXE56895.1 NADPH-dependent FMN reductase [Methanoculleus taiwanensis]
MTISVLGVSGSPHRHGNTETLLDGFLEGAERAGAEIEKVVLKNLDYTPCKGCNACHRTGACIVHDELEGLFEKILGADCLAVASPIYSMGITAELKGVIDRAQYLWARKFMIKDLYFSHNHIMRHKGVFLSTAGLGWDTVFDAAFPAITAFFNTTGFEYYDNIIANDMDRYGGIHGHPTALAEAREKGKEVVGVLEHLLQKEVAQEKRDSA